VSSFSRGDTVYSWASPLRELSPVSIAAGDKTREATFGQLLAITNGDVLADFLAAEAQAGGESSNSLNDKGGFEETEHPRRSDGKFGTGAGGASPIEFTELSNDDYDKLHTQDRSHLSDEQKYAIGNYCEEAYTPINEFLRTGKVAEHWEDEGEAFVNDNVAMLDDAMAPAPQNLMTFRGLGWAGVPAGWQDSDDGIVGSTVEDKGYLSTTLIKPRQFSDHMKVRLAIEVPEGHPQLVPGSLSDFNENEMILGRGSKMIVTEAARDGDTLSLRVRVVTSDSQPGASNRAS
jgi:hypothetical protein